MSQYVSMPIQEVVEDMKKRLENKGTLAPDDCTDEDVHTLHELGYNLYQVGQYKDSEEVFQKLVLINPVEKDFWQGLASSMQMQKKYEEALIPWSLFCLLDRDNPLPHYHAAECLFSLKRHEYGIQALEAAESRHPSASLKSKIDALKNIGQEDKVCQTP